MAYAMTSHWRSLSLPTISVEIGPAPNDSRDMDMPVSPSRQHCITSSTTGYPLALTLALLGRTSALAGRASPRPFFLRLATAFGLVAAGRSGQFSFACIADQ